VYNAFRVHKNSKNFVSNHVVTLKPKTGRIVDYDEEGRAGPLKTNDRPEAWVFNDVFIVNSLGFRRER